MRHVWLVPLLAAMSVQSQAQTLDPPGRVARLSDVEGAVSLQPAGMDEWTAASLNRPLTIGDQLWIDAGRAELELGNAAVRLGGGSAASVLDLSDSITQLRLASGTVSISLRSLGDQEAFEIDTPNVAVALQRSGAYRISVDATGATSVTVNSGTAQVIDSAQAFELDNGQGGVFGRNRPADIGGAAPPDGFDAWSGAREQRLADSSATDDVSPEVVGYEDLGDYGQWQSDPDYGPVWYPTAIASGWAPYQYGQWLWVAPWGWTWVDAAPWGFAPFHYGRWVSRGARWGWVPGPRGARPMYAPALVAWIVPGGVGLGAQTIGWLPLGPGEVYVPAGDVSVRYIQRINLTNTTGLSATSIARAAANPGALGFRNRSAPDAMSAIPAAGFTAGAPVATSLIRPPTGWHASATARAPAIAPSQQSVLGAHGPGHAPPAQILTRQVIAARRPPPQPARFDQQLAAVRASGGRPPPVTQLNRLATQAQAASLVRVSPAMAARPARYTSSPQALPAAAPGIQEAPVRRLTITGPPRTPAQSDLQPPEQSMPRQQFRPQPAPQPRAQEEYRPAFVAPAPTPNLQPRAEVQVPELRPELAPPQPVVAPVARPVAPPAEPAPQGREARPQRGERPPP